MPNDLKNDFRKESGEDSRDPESRGDGAALAAREREPALAARLGEDFEGRSRENEGSLRRFGGGRGEGIGSSESRGRRRLGTSAS
jgi:hypothetical protein